ncbi:MAG: hypothetical protein LN414_07335, partial [Candidatus Thermoplasmatota archaeon]|nr:hypothetical protein [Candidatus Thermoplasmatota archaeon]
MVHLYFTRERAIGFQSISGRNKLKIIFNISDNPIKHDKPQNKEEKGTGLYYVAQFRVESLLTASS